MLRFAFEEIDAIRDQVLEAWGEEAGGLLAAHGDDVVLTLQASNCASDPRREFGIEDSELANLLESIEERELELAGTWHSHPSGSPHMSHADAAMAGSTGVLLIVAPGRWGWDWALWDPLAGRRVEFAIAPPVA